MSHFFAVVDSECAEAKEMIEWTFVRNIFLYKEMNLIVRMSAVVPHRKQVRDIITT